ncbi:MAG TPA: hypothetical protein VGU22_06880 [Methylomirabilota bacterium]|nr:hypothetical protein [Methylomirabilota bacterium]
MTVHVDVEPRDIAAGPSDAIIETIDTINKFGYHRDDDESIRRRPPYTGRRRAPLPPNADGHFEFAEDTREFSVASPFAIIHTVLRIWRHYFERPLPWDFASTARPQLELIPHIRSYNAWSGGGALEFGYPDYPDRLDRPFCENFEVVAHETGHLIMKSVIGTMPEDEKSLQHRAHEEAAADLVAMVAVLQFDIVVDRVLAQTDGQLYGANLLSRIGEWGVTNSEVERTLFNEATMTSVRKRKDLNKHALSLPFSGAVYDFFVEVFKAHLVHRRALSADVARRARHRPGTRMPDVGAAFTRARRAAPAEFREALLDARDEVARLLAMTWRATPRDGVTFASVAGRLLAITGSNAIDGGRAHSAMLADVFLARGISPSLPA